MHCSRNGLALAVGMSALLLSLSARADWAQSTDPLVVKAAPANSQVQPQNPPSFIWARHPTGPAAYEVEITPVGGSPARAVVNRNWYLPTKALPMGNYTWRVRPANSSNWSSPRAFSITSKSTVWEVPDNATLRSRIISKARPRLLPPSFTPYSSWSAARHNDLDGFVSRLTNVTRLQMGALPDLSDALWPLVIRSPLTAAMAAQQAAVRQRVNEATLQLESAAALWRLKREGAWLTETLKRGDQLAALSPSGPTNWNNQDQATRQIALSLIKTIDILAGDLDATRKARWLDVVRARTNEMYNNLAGDNGRLDQYPFDSHGNTALVYLAVISTLSLGDIADAQKWFDFSFRAYAKAPEPWSGPEGGYAQGTAYAEYEAGYAVALWDPLLQVTGVNFYAKPWTIGFLDFAMQFIPPGSKVHAFGDGSETAPNTRVWRAFASRLVSPRAAWYVSEMPGLEDPLSRIMAPYPLPVAGTKARIAPANSAYFPSIGWASMHSDIASANRVSLYFKSSPYGSFNHSQGDQNGLLLSVARQPLLIKAGWYDWYGSPQWGDWYHQTRSQNAITFDGGKGQNVAGYRETLLHNGKITGFAAQPGYDYAEGDATAAYAGALTMAKRQVWHLRGAADAILVRDKLSAGAAHTYEFNIHAPVAIAVESPLSVKIAAGGQSVCLRSLNDSATFARWTGPAAKPGVFEGHGAFYLKGAANATAEFLVLLDVGCKHPGVGLNNTSGVRTVTIGGQKVTLD